ncbi:MAG: copper chaperone [Mycobacterium sp.]|nr:copper chaperone [Mycobacterium sp.]
MSTEAIVVPEISCAACKTAIEGALAPLEGVRAAVVDIAGKRVSVDFDESRIGRERLVAAIEDAGYDVPGEG